MKVRNILPFCLTNKNDLGIALQRGPFASAAWCISEQAFDKISGYKFAWLAPDGYEYIDSKDIMRRPTEQEVLELMSPAIKSMALLMGLIEDESNIIDRDAEDGIAYPGHEVYE